MPFLYFFSGSAFLLWVGDVVALLATFFRLHCFRAVGFYSFGWFFRSLPFLYFFSGSTFILWVGYVVAILASGRASVFFRLHRFRAAGFKIIKIHADEFCI